MRKIILLITALASISNLISAEVPIKWVDYKQKILDTTMVDENAVELTLRNFGGKEIEDLPGLEKLTKLKKLTLTGMRWYLTSDKFMERIPKIETLIIHASPLFENWDRLVKLTEIKVLIFQNLAPTPDRLTFAREIHLKFLAIPWAERFPILKGYGHIDVLDLSHGIFKEPLGDHFLHYLGDIDVIYMDDFVYPPGNWAPPRVKFTGINEFYEKNYPEAIL